MTEQVALTAVGGDADVPDGLDRLLGLLGAPLSGLRAGDEVLIKPNLFQTAPGFHVRPALLAAIAKVVAGHGARPVIAERTHAIYEILNDHEAAKYARVVSFDDLPLRITGIPGATSLRVPIAVPELILDCDFFIGVPQLRTHASVVYSNAMKNLVGLLPGYTTRIVHMAGVDESTVDLNLMRPQDLVVCDGTTVIEGNYPMDGQAREAGFLAASRNAVALDVAVGTLAGFDPGSVAYLRDAHERGMGPLALDDVELLGTPLPELAFDMVKAPVEIVVPREGIHVYAEHACPACSRFVAGAMKALAGELCAWDGEMTVISGPQVVLPPLRGEVVLVGNCLYERRDLGIFVEGCPPRAIQLAAFRYAMGKPVGDHERTQFRVPAGRAAAR
ncbi:DUF362 domain-containing protein [Amycolatopsis sp. A133]|uniref:DUF362 domain-containing protein n=1 Tax=Amycolatopsis sp. A133 TaxID=3064472 RepID=UPI0027F20748|nr:DUF362 domain-containing protein [Amycolatopsis sp. A133]MDQ7803617.1 DUF362 domain-containing protein [Amycolatopsis sp. A133]